MISSEGISRVRVFALPIGISSNGQSNRLTGFAIVSWYSTYSNLAHQVYVNGRFAGATTEPLQRQIVVSLPISQETAIRIDVFAVDYGNANTDYSETINAESNQSRIKIEFPKMIDGCIDIYHEEEKLNNESIKISEYTGFGLSSFGASDFGYDGSEAVGLGNGSFGFGMFGFDADVFCWQSEQLGTGVYKLNLKITDDKGNQTQYETESKTIIEPAKPAENVIIESFDKTSNKLIITAL